MGRPRLKCTLTEIRERGTTGALVQLLAAVQIRAIGCVLAGDFSGAAAVVEERVLLSSVIGLPGRSFPVSRHPLGLRKVT